MIKYKIIREIIKYRCEYHQFVAGDYIILIENANKK